MGNLGRLARPVGRDWFVVSWADVWERTRLAPHDVPGVVPLDDKPPYLHRVHLTHLSILGFDGAASRGDRGHRTAGELPTPDALRVLRPHQMQAVRFIRARRGSLVADEQRVGKTVEIIYSHDHTDGLLFVTGPLAARASWHEWAARRYGWCGVIDCSICARIGLSPRGQFPPVISFLAFSGRKFNLDTATLDALNCRVRVVFAHYAVLPTWRALFEKIKIGTFAADEAHLAGIQNRRSLTIESVRFLNTISKRTVFATGTPLYNRPSGLWPILDIVTPGAFGGYWEFARRYCDARPTAHGWQAKGATNIDELRERLGEVMIRRTWAEIAPGLPPISRSLEIVPLPQAVKDNVEETAARIRRESGGSRTAVGDLARLRKLYAAEKGAAAIEITERTLGDGHNLLLWTWHKDIARALGEALAVRGVRVFGPVDGDMPPDEREATVEAARAHVGPCVIIATMGTLSTAVNLSFCSHELFVELDWNALNISQSEMRPFDGTRPISATFLVADCEVEQRLADSLLSTLELMQRLGLSAGVGSVENVLRQSLGVENPQTLADLADAVLMEATT